MVQGFQKVPTGEMYPKRALWSNVFEGYLVVQGIQKTPIGPRHAKGYLKVQCIQNGNSGIKYPKGTYWSKVS